MVFSSAIFLLAFLPIVFISNYFIKKEYSNYLLLIASLIFYAWGEPYLVLLMIFSILVNWFFGLLINKTCNTSRKLILAGGIIIDLSILGYFKYAGFFVKIINFVVGSNLFPIPKISLPIGISFFTFQAISYIVDVYRGDTEASNNPVNVALYISFFPQLIAGPIVKYRDINKQIEQRSIRWDEVSDGFKRFIYGLGKKIIISNVLGSLVDTIYANEIGTISSGVAWLGAFAYTFQIYYDFSG